MHKHSWDKKNERHAAVLNTFERRGKHKSVINVDPEIQNVLYQFSYDMLI